MIKRLLQIKFTSITSAAVVIGAAGLVSRLLGIVRDRVLAGQFGAGLELDVYFSAFRVPDLVYNLIVLGALSAGFIPVFISLIKKENSDKFSDNKSAWLLTNNVLNILALFLIVASTILVIFSHKIIPLITPGFTGEKLQLTINLTRLMFFSPLILGISGIFGGVLQSYKRFFAFSLAPIMYNLGIIFGAIFLTNHYGIYGLAYGVILGAVFHLLIQLFPVVTLGFRYRFVFNFRDKNFLKIVKMMGPRILGLASTQINLIVITILGSTLVCGSISIFNFANNLQNFPIGLFGISFAIAAFPALSKSFSDKVDSEFFSVFVKTFKQIIFFIIPFSVIFLILRVQIVRVILGSGQFNWEDTILTANSLGLFCLSLFAQALIPLLARAFYARHNSVLPFIASFVSVLVNVFLSWYLIRKMGVLGLALGFSISSIINFILLVVMLKIKIRKLRFIGIVRSLFQISVASLAMGVAIQYVKSALGNIVDMERFWGVFVQGFVAGIIGLAVFSIVCIILKNNEFYQFASAFKRKMFKLFKIKGEGMRESGGN
jgi:putative peptidoglycan lipid II flippase